MNCESVSRGSAGAPRVSVVIANYNGAAYLAEAIASVQRQALRDIEIIVSDDASRDDSVKIVHAAMTRDSRIRLICAERNGGPGAARNQALALARGSWIAVMDSDDVMREDRLSRLIDAADADGADIVADDLVVFDERGSRPIRNFLNGRWARGASWIDIADYVALNRFYGPGPTLGYLKPLFRIAAFAPGALRYDGTLRVGEDYDLVLRLLLAGARFRVYPFGLYGYRRHDASVSHRLDESALAAIEVADGKLRAVIPPGDRRLARAWAVRSRSIEVAIAYERLLVAIKAHDATQTLRLALANPRAAALLRMPLVARLQRVVTLLLPRAAGSKGQAMSADLRDRPFPVPPLTEEARPIEVAVCICTLRRPSSLLVAMESVVQQELPSGVQFKMIVVDNDRTPTAQFVVDAVRARADFPVEYRHCPGENISIARNAALDAATESWLAFLDDDERASPRWIADLVAARAHAQAVFGPCEAVYREDAPAWMRRGDFHSNRIAAPHAAIETGYTSNVLIDMSFVRRHGLRFDVSLGRSGGEDTIFFHAMRRLGAVLAYAPGAAVYEEVATARTNAGWITRRKYRAGQTYALMLRRFSPRRYALSKWTSPLKIAACAIASAACAFDQTKARWWMMRGVFHVGVLSFALGARIHQEYEPLGHHPAEGRPPAVTSGGGTFG